jgi:small neutral amino acid transporter SnatA (MarC family)
MENIVHQHNPQKVEGNKDKSIAISPIAMPLSASEVH